MILLPIFLSNCISSVSDASEAYFPSPDSQGGWRMLTDADDILQVAGMDRGKDAIALGKEDGMYENGRSFTTSTLWCEPGGGYSYATASIHIASIMLRHVAGMELQDYVDRHLARPLGWERWNYAYRYAKKVTHTPGGGGIALRGTDMLRFGYMLLREGKWGDEQLVPEEYVRHCERQSPYNPHYSYSLQFHVNSDDHLSDVPRDAFWKSGSGGHALYVVPSLDLVIWKLGGRDGQYTMGDTGMPEIPTQDDTRIGWKSSVSDQVALRQTFKMVMNAIQE